MRVRMMVLLLAFASGVGADVAYARDPMVRPSRPDKGEDEKDAEKDGNRKVRPGAERTSAGEAGDESTGGMPDPDQPAAEPTEEGLDTWVRRMEGEPAPPAAVVHEIEERTEEQDEELRMIDGLTNPVPPKDFYTDPKKALQYDPLHLADIDPSEFDIPVVVNDEVISWMRYFTGPGRKYYERYLSRSTRYRPMMYRELEKQGLPRDLVYLSMIESGYSPHAYSSADAAGLWQFIAATGKLYHLRIDYWVDERRDPELSTIAGVTHLGDLNEMAGDWYLAWGGYNAGPGRIKKATERAGSRDFWVLARGPYLHPETDNYVPKIIAAAIIGHHPERYGFDNIRYQDELVYDKAEVSGSVDLGVLAKCAGISLEEFQALNPALRRWATPPEGYTVRVPVGSRDTFLAALADVPKTERVAVSEHTVRRGETLGIIADKYNTTVYDIVRANHLRDKDVISVGQTLVIPKAGEGGAMASARPSEPPSTTGPSSASRTVAAADPAPRASSEAPAPKAVPPKYHTVRSGDTLSAIADKYDVSVTQVKSWNSLKSDKILVGQKLKVGAGSSGAAVASGSSSAPKSTASSASTSSGTTKVTYVVKKGDTLSVIADKHDVSMASVQKWNGIKSASTIYVGQKLTLYQPAPAWTSYTVRSGDSLGEIATKYGVSVAELRDWNDLSTTVIRPGQVLKVKRA